MTVKVVRLDGKRLLGRAGRHGIVTDRKLDEGGADTGCTSGELLLLAIGSCATGAVRNFLDWCGLPSSPLAVEVSFAPPRREGDRDSIAIVVRLPDGIPNDRLADIKSAAVSGGVVSRMRLGSTVDVAVIHER